MSGECFGVGCDDVRGAEGEWLLEIRGGGGVVDGDENVLRRRGGDQLANVADVELRVCRRLYPQEPRSVERVCLTIIARWSQANPDADGLQPARCKQSRRVVRVGRKNGHVAGAERRAEYRLDRGHAGGECDRVSALEHSKGGFPCRPCRILKAPVGERMSTRVSARHVGRRELWSVEKRTVVIGTPVTRMQDGGVAMDHVTN